MTPSAAYPESTAFMWTNKVSHITAGKAVGRFPKVSKFSTRLARTLLGESQATHARLFIYVAFYVVFANIPYWLAASAFGLLIPGFFCAELVAVGVLALFAPPFISAVLFTLVTAADLLAGVSKTYYLPIHVCLADLIMVRSFRWGGLSALALVGTCVLLCATAAAALSSSENRPTKRCKCAIYLVAFVTLFGSCDLLTYFLANNRLPWPFPSFSRVNGFNKTYKLPQLERVPTRFLIIKEKEDSRTESLIRNSVKSGNSVPSAAAIALGSAGLKLSSGGRSLPNVVLVVVESWGLANDRRLRDALIEPYTNKAIHSRYQIAEGSVPFNGATIAAEARELCGNMFGYHVLDASANELKNCLPDRMKLLGYYSLGLHGMTGNFFWRSRWYRTIGFDEQIFHSQFKSQGLPDCAGAFTGTCDASIAAWIGRRLQAKSDRPYFVHWMTLDSHLPVPIPPQLPQAPPCTAELSLPPRTALCSWFQIVENVHASIAQLALIPSDRGTIFVLVGDHAPPFGDPTLRRQFSQTDVPYLVLTPRSPSGPYNRMAPPLPSH